MSIELLTTRRSIRKYESRQIKKEELDQILLAGTYAPTGRNRQTPWIIAVQDKEERDAVSKLNASIMGADTRNVDGRAFGTMLISLPEELNERRRVLDYLNGFEGVTAEEVR